MKNNNKNSSRFYSSKQEDTVAKELCGRVQTNSGAGKFDKSDVIVEQASILIECKTCETDKESFSIKKSWIKKNKEECLTQRVSNGVIAFNFGPDQENYYVIDTKLMKFLLEKLREED